MKQVVMSTPGTTFLEGFTFRPEETLLILGARTRLDEASAAHINALLHKDLDWDYLLRMAFQHSVVPLLYKSLLPAHAEGLPKPFADELRAYFHGNALRNMVLTRELLALVEGLEALNIPSLPFKGPALAVTAYGDLSLRQFGDLDLLVQKKNLERAEEFFYGRGYRSREPQTGNKQLKRVRVFLRGYHHKLEKEDGGVLLEPHWHVEGRHLGVRFDIEGLWKRLQRVSLGGREVRAVPPEDLLLFLCVHGSRHLWRRLSWMADVAELVRRTDFDWDAVLKKAERTRSHRMLSLGLLLAREVLGTALPPDVIARVQADPVRDLVPGILRTLFAPPEPTPQGEKYAFYLRLHDRPTDKGLLYLYYYTRGLPVRL